jgi:hypothetical protein
VRHFLIFAILILFYTSCQKEYVCVCTNEKTGEKTFGEKVRTTNLGKKGFEKACKSTNDTINRLKDCHVE